MAVLTLGTNANNSLSALLFSAVMTPADFATLQQAIKNDKNVSYPTMPGAFNRTGQLLIPNRGMVQVLPGDYVAVDSTGWPIVLSARAIAAGPWTHS